MIEKIKNLLHLNREKVETDVEVEINEMFDTLSVDELSIQIGQDLIPFGNEISEQIHSLRKKIKDQTGLIIPAVRILDNIEYQENEYQIKIREKTAFTGYTVPKEDYATNEITRNLEKTCFENVDKVLTNEMTEKYINYVQRENGWLIWYLSRLIPTTGIKVILSDLLKNGKSIKDITYIFEKICEKATCKAKDCYSIPDPYKIAKELNCELK